MTTIDATLPRCSTDAPVLTADPPDLATAQAWFGEVTADIETTEAALADLKGPTAPRDLRDLTRQRSDLIAHRADLADRQRKLRGWIERHDGRPPMRSLGQRSLARDREIRVDAMHAACRRFVLLEELFHHVETFVHDPDAASWVETDAGRHIHDLWRPIVDQVETIQNHGAG